jgi:hypothetical protein
MIDLAAMLYGPIYENLGVTASLLAESEAVAVTVLDKTKGAAWGDRPEVQTLKPLATVRVSELTAKGVAADDLDDSLITFNGGTWKIIAHRPKPAFIGGEAEGEIDLLLTEESGSA